MSEQNIYDSRIELAQFVSGILFEFAVGGDDLPANELQEIGDSMDDITDILFDALDLKVVERSGHSMTLGIRLPEVEQPGS
jgi:hypothetical protein